MSERRDLSDALVLFELFPVGAICSDASCECPYATACIGLNEKESVDTSRNLSTKVTEVLSSEYESPTIPNRRTQGSSIVEREMSQNCLWVLTETIALE